MVLNAHHDTVKFVMPYCAGGRRWSLVFDTGAPERTKEQLFRIGDTYSVIARSLLLLALHA